MGDMYMEFAGITWFVGHYGSVRPLDVSFEGTWVRPAVQGKSDRWAIKEWGKQIAGPFETREAAMTAYVMMFVD